MQHFMTGEGTRLAQSNHGAETQRRSQDYPEDRFDRVTRSGRVGAHRVTAKPRHFWWYLVAGVLGFVLLTCIGVLVVQSVGGKSPTPTSEQQPTSTEVPAVLDPAATIAVFNGTTDTNLGAGVSGSITAEGWGQVLFSENLAESDVPISAVFYRDPADESAARGLAEQLGGVSTYLTEDYAEYDARLIVLLGADYAGPNSGAVEQPVEPPVEEPAAGDAEVPPADGSVDGAVVDPAATDPQQPEA